MARGFTLRIDYPPDFRRRCEELAEPALKPAGEMVLAAMHRFLPASEDGSHGREPGYARSRLGVLRAGRDEIGPFREVGTDAESPEGVNYPAILEYGQKPHVIESKGPWPLRNPQTGQVFGRKVMHPGAKPIPWARRSAAAINGRRFRL